MRRVSWRKDIFSLPLINLHLPFHQQKTLCTIAAHEGTLAAIAFNAAGSKLASASEKVSAPVFGALLRRAGEGCRWPQRADGRGQVTRGLVGPCMFVWCIGAFVT